MWKKIRLSLLVILIIVLISVIINYRVDGKLLSLQNIISILVTATPQTFASWALCFLSASGTMDFSMGAIITLSAITSTVLGNTYGIAGVIFGSVSTGVILVFLNMVIYRVTKISPWIAGLGMTLIYEAFSVIYLNYRMEKFGTKEEILNHNLRYLGHFPLVFVVLIIGFFVAYFIYNKMNVGLNIRAIGNNRDVAVIMGINVNRTLLVCSVIAGVFIGAAGLTSVSYNGQGYIQSGLSSISQLFKPLAALLLAQTSQKKVNIIIAIPIMTFFIVYLFNILTMLDVPSGTWQDVCLGAVVIICGMIAQRKAEGVVK